MTTKALTLLLMLCHTDLFAAFTEFYVQTSGSNLNAGSSASAAADFTYSAGTFVRASGVFTVAGDDPSTDGVTVGNFASVYTTAGATVATFVGRVTARNATSITVSTSAISGSTLSVSEAAGAATLKVGGAWAGPTGIEGFPIGFVASTLRNSLNDVPRINFKGGIDYNISAPMTAANNGSIVWQGYSTVPGDGGRAVIDGGTAGIYYNLLRITSLNNLFDSFVFTHNGGSGAAADGVTVTAAENVISRCVFHHLRRSGIRSASNGPIISCEAYACNQSNTANFGAISILASGAVVINCIAHDNTGSNVDGFGFDGGTMMIGCIAESNGRHGAFSTADVNQTIISCEFYNNGGSGIVSGGGALDDMSISYLNCNFVRNGAYGINFSGTTRVGFVTNCGFGTGTQANVAGSISAARGLFIQNLVNYSADKTPWVDPANGDFRIIGTEARNAGFGDFTQTAPGYGGTLAYPDIGAARSRSSSGESAASFVK